MDREIWLKQVRLRRLARLRCSCQWPGYKQPEDFGYHFEDLVSPYTQTAGNLYAKIMLILQDWASADGLSKMGFNDEVAEVGRNPKLLTNVKLEKLMEQYWKMKLGDIYATNLFPFIKQGKMSAPIPFRDLQRAARMFTLREIIIVKPRYVITLGARTARAIRSVTKTVKVHMLPHPAARIGNVQMHQEWRRLSEFLEF